MTIDDLALRRFLRLPQRANDVWQGGLMRMPTWIKEDDQAAPWRPTAAVWHSGRTDLISVVLESPRGSADAHLLLHTLMEFAQKHTKELVGRPAGLDVTDPAIAAELRMLLPDTNVVVVDNLPAVRAAMTHFIAYAYGDAPGDSLDIPGMTIDRLRAFADAAAEFHRVRPWRLLHSDDLIEVAAPDFDPALCHVSVVGGMMGDPGLLFLPSRASFQSILDAAGLAAPPSSIWTVQYDDITRLPFGDADVWEAEHLAVNDPAAYPLLVQVNAREGRMGRPTAQMLTQVEALLRAFAQQAINLGLDHDAGAHVPSFDGEREIALTMRMPMSRPKVRARQTERRTPTRKGKRK